MPLTQIKRECARVSVCLRVIFLLNTQIVVFSFASVVYTQFYRSTSLSYYLIIMFFFSYELHAPMLCRRRSIISRWLSAEQSNFIFSLQIGRTSVGQRVAKAFDVAKHYLPLTRTAVDCTYPSPGTISFRRITHCCHFARIQNTTHTRLSSVPIL